MEIKKKKGWGTCQGRNPNADGQFLLKVSIWNSSYKHTPDFKIIIKAPNKLKIPHKTIWTSFRDALKSGGKKISY